MSSRDPRLKHLGTHVGPLYEVEFEQEEDEMNRMKTWDQIGREASRDAVLAELAPGFTPQFEEPPWSTNLCPTCGHDVEHDPGLGMVSVLTMTHLDQEQKICFYTFAVMDVGCLCDEQRVNECRGRWRPLPEAK
jgi:hypothetical protein